MGRSFALLQSLQLQKINCTGQDRAPRVPIGRNPRE